MADEGFEKTVTAENGPELVKFAYYVLLYYFEHKPAIAEEKNLQRKLAMWLRDKYPEDMIDPNAPLSDAKFIINKRINIPPKKEILEIIDVYEIKLPCDDDVINVASRLCNPYWLDNEENEISDNEKNYYIEERDICLSVNMDGGGDYKVTFSVYKQLTDGKYKKIAENLLGNKKEGTNTYISKWLYKRERELKREENVKLYFRSYKDNYTETETDVRPFVDGIVAIETERNNKRIFFDFSDYNGYGGHQSWYEDEVLKGVAGWNPTKGKRMNESGCGPIAATNVIYYYAQQFTPLFAKLKTSKGLQDTDIVPTQKDYIHMAFSVYNNYTMQTIPEVGWGIWFIDPLCDGIVRFAKERGVNMTKNTLTNKIISSNNSFRQAVDFITNGLKNNYPVFLLVTLNKEAAWLEKHHSEVMGERHFVTITAIERVEQDNEDYKLVVSTWAKRQIIPSLKRMWEGTPAWFNGLQIITTPTIAGLITHKFASVSLGYCSFA